METPRILVCTPCRDEGEAEAIRHHVHEVMSFTPYKWHHSCVGGPIIADNRNDAVLNIEGWGSYTHVLQWDTDVRAMPDDVMALVDDDLGIVSGLVPLRLRQDAFNAAVEHANESGGVTEHLLPVADPGALKTINVAWAGAAFILIKTDVLRRLPRPWFRHEIVGEHHIGEDIGFCRNARRHGYAVHADAHVRCQHIIDRAEAVPEKDVSVEAAGYMTLSAYVDLGQQIQMLVGEVARLVEENASLRASINGLGGSTAGSIEP